MDDVEVIKTEDASRFSLKFGGDGNNINASTYGVVLVNTVTLIEEANKELETGVHLDIKVNSERPGSFIVDLGIHPQDLHALIGMIPPNIETITAIGGKIIGLVSSALELRKKLKGEPPKKVAVKDEGIYIESSSGNTLTVNKNVFNITLTNPQSMSAMKAIFKSLEEDKKVDDFTVLDKSEQETFHAEKKDFPELVPSNPVSIEETRVFKEEFPVNIVKVSFEQNLTWEFIYRGSKVSAYVKDPEFWEKVNNDEKFGKGDVLVVELEIEQVLDPSYGAYLNSNKPIIITKVLGHLPKSTQTKLFAFDSPQALPAREFDFGEESEEGDKENEDPPRLLQK